MNTEKWHISISHPYFCRDQNTFMLNADQLREITRNHDFNDMIDGSEVMGGLIAAVEAIQDPTH